MNPISKLYQLARRAIINGLRYVWQQEVPSTLPSIIMSLTIFSISSALQS